MLVMGEPWGDKITPLSLSPASYLRVGREIGLTPRESVSYLYYARGLEL